MFIIALVLKFYMIVLLFRFVATNQELVFNPVGKTVALLTDPVFKLFKTPKDKSDVIIPVLIAVGVIFNGFLGALFTKTPLIGSIFYYTMDYLRFFMVFFIICVILGNFVDKVAMSSYITYFFRLGMPWVKFTRMLLPVSGGKIIYPTMLIIFLAYMVASALTLSAEGLVSGSTLWSDPASAARSVFIVPLKYGLMGAVSILYYAGWLVVFRALMSWVSPDIRNPFVQMIYVLTEPILSPFRKLVPPLGMLDLSALAAILVLYAAGVFLQRIINLI